MSLICVSIMSEQTIIYNSIISFIYIKDNKCGISFIIPGIVEVEHACKSGTSEYVGDIRGVILYFDGGNVTRSIAHRIRYITFASMFMIYQWFLPGRASCVLEWDSQSLSECGPWGPPPPM